MLIFATKKMQHGFAMFEVMITAFVLCFGVLALAKVQMKTFSLTRNSSVRSNVAMQAEALAESMQANPIRTLDKVSKKMTWRLDHYKTGPVTGNITNGNICTNNCTQEQLAASDLYTFQKSLHELFPANGSVVSQVCYTSDFSKPSINNMGCDGNGDQLAIKVAWHTKATNKETQIASNQTANYIDSGYVLKIGGAK